MKYKIRLPHSQIEKVILLMYWVYAYLSILDASLLSFGLVMRILRWGVTIGGLFLFCLMYMNKGMSIGRLILISSVLILFFIAAETTDRSYLIVYAVFIILSSRCKFEDVVRTSLFSASIALITILALCGLGVLTDYIYYQSGNREAHCFGFAYYSTFPFIVFYCSAMFLYLKKEKATLLNYIVIALINILMYRATTLRLTFYLTFILIGIDFLLVKIKKINLDNKVITVVSGLLFPIGTIITYLVMLFYNGSDVRWTTINLALNGRIRLMHRGFLQYPISLFGNSIEMEGNNVLRATTNYFYIDSGFAFSLLGYGLLFTIVVVLLYSYIYVYSCKTNNKHLFVWITCILIFTMINNTWVSINYNPVLMLSLLAVAEVRKSKKKKHIMYQHSLETVHRI